MSYKFSLCSEVFKTPIDETIRQIAEIGFDGVEIAPFNVAKSVDDVSPSERDELRESAREAGLEIVGLHWLLVSPAGLHLTTADQSVRQRTVEYIKSLARFCGDVGGHLMILGSPSQRNIEPGTEPREAFERAAQELRVAAPAIEDCGVKLLLEPLSPKETNFLQTVEEALELLRAIDHPAVGYILDCKAMSDMPKGIVTTTREYAKGADHFHTNEPGGKGPGMGDLDFEPVFRALKESGYQGWVSAEPFDYTPDSETVARKALETLRSAAAAAEC